MIKIKKYLKYSDVNELYGYAMSQMLLADEKKYLSGLKIHLNFVKIS